MLTIGKKDERKLKGWDELPSVVMVEITKYLPSRKDRLNTASVCKSWRNPGFQLPLSDSLTLDMTMGKKGLPKVTFLSRQFIVKVKHVTFTFDVSTEACLNTVQEVLNLLESNHQLKTLKLYCSRRCLAYLQRFGTILEGQGFIQKVLYPLLKVLKGKAQLENFSFPLIQNFSIFTGRSLLATLSQSRNRFYISNLFLPSLKDSAQSVEEEMSLVDVTAIPELASIQSFVKLQMLSMGHDYLNDQILEALGRGSTTGGLKRLNVVACLQNTQVSNRGWTTFVGNNPECKVRLTVYGGSGLVAHASNLIFPSTPLSHFRSYYSKEMRVNFLNSVIGWNLDTLEHLEFVGECNSTDLLIQNPLEPDADQFLDPLVFAAWRCKKLHTIKLGIGYCGDSLVGIARLKRSSLLNLEIPKSCIVNNSLNLRKLIKEVSSALGRPWRPLNFKESHTGNTFENGGVRMALQAMLEDEL